MTKAEEQDLNRQVAEALGCTQLIHNAAGWWCSCGKHSEWPGGLLRDYLHNKGWAVDTLDANKEHIHEIQLSGGMYTLVAMRIGGPDGRGRTLAESMARWVIAARKAGIEVRQ